MHAILSDGCCITRNIGLALLRLDSDLMSLELASSTFSYIARKVSASFSRESDLAVLSLSFIPRSSFRV
jgi:hypothetical protein